MSLLTIGIAIGIVGVTMAFIGLALIILSYLIRDKREKRKCQKNI